MFVDVVQQRAFYTSRLGVMSRRLIRAQIHKMWGDLSGLRLLGLGYATPYLRHFPGEPERITAMMPAQQGVMRWPQGHANQAGLCHESQLPLREASYDRIVVAHLLEQTDRLAPMLREVWRVLAPQGRVIFIVPNRRSIWARLDRTPFGHGRPFSQGQLGRALDEAMFVPLSWGHALSWPPGRSRLMIRLLGSMERLGLRLWGDLSGVMIVEAEKRVYAKIDGHKARQALPLWAPAPAGQLARAPSDLDLSTNKP